MFKWIGVIMVVLGSTMTGYELYAEKKKTKLKTEAFIKTLTFMRDEMQYSKAYLENVFVKCIEFDENTKAFFVRVSDGLKEGKMLDVVWREAVSESECLNEETKRTIADISDVLGTVDMDVQSKHIDRCIGTLEQILHKQTEELGKKGNMYPKIGFLSGVLISILLF